MRAEVDQIESNMQQDSIFMTDSNLNLYHMLDGLDTSERRLLIVFSVLDSSIQKTARYFHVDRKTVAARISEIRQKLLQND